MQTFQTAGTNTKAIGALIVFCYEYFICDIIFPSMPLMKRKKRVNQQLTHNIGTKINEEKMRSFDIAFRLPCPQFHNCFDAHIYFYEFFRDEHICFKWTKLFGSFFPCKGFFFMFAANCNIYDSSHKNILNAVSALTCCLFFMVFFFLKAFYNEFWTPKKWNLRLFTPQKKIIHFND